jgi:hypothetical protein
MASGIKMLCFFRQLWVSEQKRRMIVTLNRTVLVCLLLLFGTTSWNVLAEPKGKQKTATESSTAVSNDSYMGLTGEELWSNNCLRCHNIRPPTRYNNAQWDVIVHHMRIRANINGQEQRAIVEFLKSAK